MAEKVKIERNLDEKISYRIFERDKALSLKSSSLVPFSFESEGKIDLIDFISFLEVVDTVGEYEKIAYSDAYIFHYQILNYQELIIANGGKVGLEVKSFTTPIPEARNSVSIHQQFTDPVIKMVDPFAQGSDGQNVFPVMTYHALIVTPLRLNGFLPIVYTAVDTVLPRVEWIIQDARFAL